MSKPSLSTIINGILFENPFILASAPPTASNESIRKAFDAGWAGAVLKTVRPNEVRNSNVTPRFASIKNGGRVTGFQNIEMLSEKSVEYWVQTIRRIKEDYPGKVVIASVMGANKESWQEISTRMCQAGADALELNFSCPNGVTGQGLGLAIGQNKEAILTITSWVKECCSIPVVVKLTPNITDIADAAGAAVAGGADGISAINTVSCLLGVNLETLSPLSDVNGYSTYGGYSGLAVKPIGLRCVAQIAKAVQVPVYGIGGVANWKDAVEYIALGASVVQVCTEVMLKGYSIIQPMLEGLAEYMHRKGFRSLEEIRGIALKKVVDHGTLSRTYRVVANIDKKMCGNCAKCVNSCAESGYGAISQINDEPVVAVDKCDGCGLCVAVCQRDAISMVERCAV